MPNKPKIKIFDDAELRSQLGDICNTRSQIALCRFAVDTARRALSAVQYSDDDDIIIDALRTAEAWQIGDASVHEVRLAALRVHETARLQSALITKAALRCVGQAVASGHMREHAIVATDYAVKVVNMLSPFDIKAVQCERLKQIEVLNSIKD